MTGTTYFPAGDATRVSFWDGDREHTVDEHGLSFEAGSVAAEHLVASGVLTSGAKRKGTHDATVEAVAVPAPTPEAHLAVAETDIADPASALAAAKSHAKQKPPPAAEKGGDD